MESADDVVELSPELPPSADPLSPLELAEPPLPPDPELPAPPEPEEVVDHTAAAAALGILK